MIQNQTWYYIVHWTNLVHRFFFSKVQVHLGQSFVFCFFRVKVIYIFHSSKSLLGDGPWSVSSSVIALVDVVVFHAVVHAVAHVVQAVVLEVVVDVVVDVVVQGVVDDVVAGWSLDLRQSSAARS